MKNIALPLLLLLLLAIPARAGNQYIDLTPPGTMFIQGLVTLVDDRRVIVADDQGVEHILWRSEATGYYPRDYSPYLQDRVNVRCYISSVITKRIRAVEFQFLQENYKPPVITE